MISISCMATFAYETQSRGFNSYDDVKNYWSPSNTNTDIPKVSLDDRNGNRRVSTDFYMQELI